MKIFVIILAVCVTRGYSMVVTQTAKPQINSIKDICVAESGVDREKADEILSTFKANRNSEIDCFMSCIYKNVELMTEDGKLVEKTLKERLSENNIPEYEIDKVADKCRSINGDSICNSAGNLFDCLNTFQL